jgi:hypothetical protein
MSAKTVVGSRWWRLGFGMIGQRAWVAVGVLREEKGAEEGFHLLPSYESRNRRQKIDAPVLFIDFFCITLLDSAATFPLFLGGIDYFLTQRQLCKQGLGASKPPRPLNEHKSGHLALIKTTLAAALVHTTISLVLPPWVRKALIKIMRGFLWTRIESVQGEVCGRMEPGPKACQYRWIRHPLPQANGYVTLVVMAVASSL